MIYGSVCSGVEAASLAWESLGWKPTWFSEIEKFPSAVLAHRFPEIPNLGDMTKLHDNDNFRNAKIDLLVGGTPCQGFSVAGLRKGLDDPRSNLALHFLRIAELSKPRWIVWENVPGVLSSGRGRDFGSFLGALGQLGYGWAYRILDAQFFGVPQRRRRVFVVGYLGDWQYAAAVLFERESLLRNSSSRRKKRQGTSQSIEGSTVGCLQARDYKGVGNQYVAEGKIIPFHTFDRQSSGEYGTDTVDATVSARDYKSAADLVCVTGDRTHSLRREGYDASEDGTGRGNPIVSVFDPNQVTSKTNRSIPQPELAHTLPATSNSPIAFHWNARAEEQKFENLTGPITVGQQPAVGISLRGREGGGTAEITEGAAPAIRASQGGGDKPHVLTEMKVRRLTPRECERLQGMPDDWTLVPVGKKPAADGPRYKAIGNSMAVPVMHWIGKRIQFVDSLESKH